MRWLKYTEKSLIPKVKERMLLILSVESDSMVPAHIVQELHISKPWASYWLNRYVKEGIQGLR
jgi:hypothetical protein